jgi:glycerol-3-phosphate O-acyltransferase
MGDLAAEGGKIFWVAPSGGRDRPDPATGEYVVAPFDGKALDMFKLVCMQSRKVYKKYHRSMLFVCVQCTNS